MSKRARTSGTSGGGGSHTYTSGTSHSKKSDNAGGAKSHVYKNPAWYSTTKGSEVHSVDTNLTNFTVPATGVVKFIEMPAEGNGYWQRKGNQTLGKSLEIKAYIVPTLTNDFEYQLPNYMRFAVVYDSQTNGVPPVYSDIFRNISSSDSAVSDVLCGMNMAPRGRFHVFRDRRIMLPPMKIAGAQPDKVEAFTVDLSTIDGDRGGINIHDFIKLKGIKTDYLSTAKPITEANISKGAFFLVCAVASNGTGTPCWAVNYSARYRFYDP